MRHEVQFVGITPDANGANIQIDFTLDGQAFSHVYTDWQRVSDDHADLIPGPEEARNYLFFYLLQLCQGDPTKLSDYVGKKLVMQVGPTVDQSLSLV